jgi:hypothetical protein
VLRRLESTEQLAAIGNASHRGNLNVVACIELDGPITQGLLMRALEEVQRHDECLRVEISEDPTDRAGWVFRLTDEKPRLEVTQEHWRTVWNRLCDEVIEGLGWRVVWAKDALLVLFHHAVTDAASLSYFFDRLLKTMARMESGVPEIGPARSILPPMNQLVRSRVPLRALMRIGANRVFGRLATGPLTPSEPEERRWYTALRACPPDVMQRLLGRCRADGLTITHALSASATMELSRRVKSSRAHGVALCTTVDLRPLIPGLEPQRLGLLSTAIHSFFPLSGGEKVWTLAGEARRQLARAINRNEPRDMPLMHTLLGPQVSAWIERENEGRPRDCAVLISNRGRVDGLDHPPFRARTLFMTGSQAAFGSTYHLVAATVGSTLCLHLGFATPTISVDEGEAALDRIISRLLG